MAAQGLGRHLRLVIARRQDQGGVGPEVGGTAGESDGGTRGLEAGPGQQQARTGEASRGPDEGELLLLLQGRGLAVTAQDEGTAEIERGGRAGGRREGRQSP